jgi:hypothetical protein
MGRAEERERNFGTFGEAGGVGLLGPRACVGGCGGYGRRGGGAPRGMGVGVRGVVVVVVGRTTVDVQWGFCYVA